MQPETPEVEIKRKEILRYFAILVIVFVFSSFIGFFQSQQSPESAEKFVGELFKKFGFIDFSNPLQVIGIIFINNTVLAFISLLAGIFFGIFPLLFVASNGHTIGVMVFVKGDEIGITKIVALLLPHGILEIPAIILASSYGMWLGRLFFNYVWYNKKVDFNTAIKLCIKRFIRVVMPVLLISAVIETFISPLVPILLFPS
jgi:stage II sporulation protein M